MDSKFLADEHIDASAVEGLKRGGVDITSVYENIDPIPIVVKNC